MLRLKVSCGEQVRCFPLVDGSQQILGSAAECDLVVPFPGVSRRHALLERSGRWIRVRDLGSKNGLVRGRQRLPEAVLCEEGDPLRIGRAAVEIEAIPTADGDLALRLDGEPPRGTASQTEVIASGETTRSGDASPTRRELVFPDGFVLGPSAAMERVVDQLRRVAAVRLDVLLCGETGTGKELIARCLHLSGSRHLSGAGTGSPFVAINCAAIPGELLEAELFGIAGRVATGVDPRTGLVRRAHGGVLFLDEIGELPLPLQAKLLRVLQEREVLPLGGKRPEPVALRVIAASNLDLRRSVAERRFRADLYHRLAAFELALPPLRERSEDIPALALAFARRSARELDKTVRGISRGALRSLLDHGWPGNVRELENAMRRAVLGCSDGGAIENRHLGLATFPPGTATRDETAGPARPGSPAAAPPDDEEADAADRPLAAQIADLERRAIVQALVRTEGNKTRAAGRLGITRNGLSLKMKRLGIAPPSRLPE